MPNQEITYYTYILTNKNHTVLYVVSGRKYITIKFVSFCAIFICFLSPDAKASASKKKIKNNSNYKNRLFPTRHYVGVTNNLRTRVKQHKSRVSKSFTKRYNLDKLVYFETTRYVNNAIKREKQIKKWNREWKINLINDLNPDWNDLSDHL